ncbi:hypothetical protein Golax_009688 [Gossypium laxum]|uniref:Transmembrane protein n=1 Tax=Gossypium laxum TaxID=34288 RepID=A0A7J8ZF69_9ROSI|nr:hypothetical protein [Gossypium laxum]
MLFTKVSDTWRCNTTVEVRVAVYEGQKRRWRLFGPFVNWAFLEVCPLFCVLAWFCMCPTRGGGIRRWR